MRWALAIQQYDVTFCYKAGKANVVADCLSRMDQAVTDKRHSGGVLYPGVGLTIRSTSSYLKLCTVYYNKLFVFFAFVLWLYINHWRETLRLGQGRCCGRYVDSSHRRIV